MIVRQPGERAVFRADKMGKSDLAALDHLFVGLNAFEPGQSHEPHAHCDRDKLYVVVAGRAEVTIDGETSSLDAGAVAVAAAGVVHGVHNPGPERLTLLVILAPPPGHDG